MAELCVRVQAELGIAAVAGIGPTRFVAYLCARHPGPGGIRKVEEPDVPDFLAPFPVTEIWGLGPGHRAEARPSAGYTRLRRCARSRSKISRAIVGRGAGAILEYARGADREPLRPKPRARSLSQERTLEEPLVDLRSLGELLELARRAARARARARAARRADGHPGRVVRRRQPGHEVAHAARAGHRAARVRGGRAGRCCRRTQAGVRAVRRVRLGLSGLTRAESPADTRQLRLF